VRCAASSVERCGAVWSGVEQVALAGELVTGYGLLVAGCVEHHQLNGAPRLIHSLNRSIQLAGIIAALVGMGSAPTSFNTWSSK